MARLEDFPISEEILGQLIKQCEQYRLDADNGDGYIYVNLSMVRLQTVWYLPKLLYALGASEFLHSRIKVITWRRNRLFEKLLHSMGMEHLCLEDLDRKNIFAAIKAGLYTILLCVFNGSGEYLQKIRVSDLPIGMSLYEDILRTSELSTIQSTRNMTCIRKTFHLLWMIFSLDAYMKKNKPVFGIIDDIAYHESLIAAMLCKKGAKVVNVSPAGEEVIAFDDNYRTIRRGEQGNEVVREKVNDGDKVDLTEVDRYFERKFRGQEGRNIDRGAFLKKDVIGREEMSKEYGLDPSKKNIVIMAHTFSDAVFNYGVLYYRDYYDWLEHTMQIAATVNNVNWILKPHPTRKAYHEEKDSIEDLFRKYKKDNMFFLDDNVSAESIKDIADLIVTIGGNAGAEFACFGIPSVIVGKPYYKGFGYTIEPGNRKQYEEVLRKSSRIRRLTEGQIKTAKTVYYFGIMDKSSEMNFRDGFANLLNSMYKEMLDEIAMEYFENNDKTTEYNDRITKRVVDYFKQNDMRQCEYYRSGMMRAKTI